MKNALIVVTVICTSALALTCGGCFLLAEKAVKSAEKAQLAKTPEQKEKEQKERRIEIIREGMEERFKATVTKLLKAPTTAKFSLSSKIDSTGKAGVVVGDITSHNSFGAMLTKPCYGQYHIDGNEVTLVVLYFEGDKKILVPELAEKVESLLRQ